MKQIVSTLFIFIFFHLSNPAVLVHNSKKEIDACKEKLDLKLIRIWGGSNEKDERIFFATPTSMVIDKNDLVYICDRHDHCVKVIKDFGHHDDLSSNYIDSEKLVIAMDDSDHFYVANKWTPVIRKYTPEGELQMAITFETPFPFQDQVKLNSTSLLTSLNIFFIIGPHRIRRSAIKDRFVINDIAVIGG